MNTNTKTIDEAEIQGARRSTRPVGILATVAAALILPVAMTGCNTVEGAGEDIEAVGEEIDDASD